MYIFYILYVNFLPVGHTHEDVDQFFSRIAWQLRKKGAGSIPGMSLLALSFNACIIMQLQFAVTVAI